MIETNIELEVAGAFQDDVNIGKVRIDSIFRKEIGLSVGDFIGIKGKKETIAVVDRLHHSDLGKKIIRMDPLTRKNLKIGIGDIVTVFKPKILEAKKIELIPSKKLNIQSNISKILLENLQGKPIVNGNIISINPKEKYTSINNLELSQDNPMDLFNGLENNFLGVNLASIKFKVNFTNPSGFLIVGPETIIEISNSVEDQIEDNSINYEDIGGLKIQLERIRELVELPLNHPELFIRLNVSAPKGILLYGPPGTGKTLLAGAIANETDANFYSINAPEIVNKYYGESEKKLRELFEKAQKKAPSIIFIDEIDAIAVKREEVQGETEKRIVAQLLTLMDGLSKNKQVMVIAATNRPDALDAALRRPGRFDRELEIGVPKVNDRLEILKIHTRGMPLELPKKFKTYETYLTKYKKKNNLNIEKIEKTFEINPYEAIELIPEEIVKKVRKKRANKLLKNISEKTHGFVGADLEALVKEAAFNVLRRSFPNLNFNKENKISQEILNKLEITSHDFDESLKNIRPSAMREFLVDIPNVKWEDVGGLDELKQNLTEMIEWPIKNPIAFSRLGIKSPKGILLYGPPGTGKTLLAKAVATETYSNFIYVKGPEIINKYQGESEKMIRKLFEKARQNSPSILFFDEFDSIASSRIGSNDGKSKDTIVNQILTEMDGLENLVNVKVLAATNRPGLIEPALLRPGRFDKLVFVDIPDLKSREKILEVHLKKSPVKEINKLIKYIAQKTEGFVGADLEALIREAGLIALRRDINSETINDEDFDKALETIQASVNPKLKQHYENIEKEMKNPKQELENFTMNSYM